MLPHGRFPSAFRAFRLLSHQFSCSSPEPTYNEIASSREKPALWTLTGWAIVAAYYPRTWLFGDPGRPGRSLRVEIFAAGTPHRAELAARAPACDRPRLGIHATFSCTSKAVTYAACCWKKEE